MAEDFGRILSDDRTEKTKDRAVAWFKRAMSETAIDPSKLLRIEPSRLVLLPSLGHMYLFRYDPKLKHELPYYDRYPLVFPFSASKTRNAPLSGTGFHGINLHYLPQRARARLMNALMSFASDDNMNEKTRLLMTYNILQKMSGMRLYRPCIKEYLFAHVRSKFFHVHANEWKVALFLPLQRFQKASETVVYRDSIAEASR